MPRIRHPTFADDPQYMVSRGASRAPPDQASRMPGTPVGGLLGARQAQSQPQKRGLAEMRAASEFEPVTPPSRRAAPGTPVYLPQGLPQGAETPIQMPTFEYDGRQGGDQALQQVCLSEAAVRDHEEMQYSTTNYDDVIDAASDFNCSVSETGSVF